MMFYDVPGIPITLTIDGKDYRMEPRQFRSGSVGWFLGGKAMVKGIRVQLSFSAVVVGSKPAELVDLKEDDDLATLDKKLRKATKKPRKGKKGNPPDPGTNGQN